MLIQSIQRRMANIGVGPSHVMQMSHVPLYVIYSTLATQQPSIVQLDIHVTYCVIHPIPPIPMFAETQR